ncbi:MAG: large subunit ribosomal protein L25 [Hyphomicrobiaceae bacterium]|jgi:large subunit ribosomal protein L25
MRSIELTVSKRDAATNPRTVRRNGEIPAVLYGAGGPNLSLQLNKRDFGRSGAGSSGSHLISFLSEDAGVTGSLALVKDIQPHPVTGAPMHIDFLRIDVNKPVLAVIPLNYTGKAAGIVSGGVLQPVRRELEVRALPNALPEHIDVDVTALDIHDSIHVEDIVLAEGVESTHGENFTLVTILAPLVEKSATDEEEVEAAAEAETPAE